MLKYKIVYSELEYMSVKCLPCKPEDLSEKATGVVDVCNLSSVELETDSLGSW